MIRSEITKNIVLPLSDLITGNSIHRSIKFLQQSQFWSRDQIIDYQNSKLCDLINHSYNNVPFYRGLFDDLRIKPEEIRTQEDLKKLPIITKDDLKRSKSKHIAGNITKKDLLLRSSSGSTGEPFQFFVTKSSESFLFAASIRAWNWNGYLLGDRYVKVSMNPRSSGLKKIQDKINNSLYLSSTQLTQEAFSAIISRILKFDPKIIRCYPVPAYFLSQIIRDLHKTYQGHSLKAINTTGSTLHKETREYIENTFGVKIFDSYSCEGGTNFSQCPSSGYYHPAEEYAISEFVSDHFTTSDSEKPMRLITTDLHNYASPFIRYDTQDYLVMGPDKNCTCGRHFLNIKKIWGRDSDILRTPSGKYLIIENFVAYFEWIKEVEKIQIIQEDVDRIIIRLVVNDGFNSRLQNEILNYWMDYIGRDVNVSIKIVDEIPVTSAGKRRTVIRDPKVKLSD